MLLATLPIVAAVLAGRPIAALAQVGNPVYVDDSPQAWELFRQAQDQARNNAGEAVRLFQELLDEYAFKLIPAIDAAHHQANAAANDATSDHFKAVRQRVLDELLRDREGGLLERYRLIQTPAAEQMLQSGDLEQLAITRPLTTPGLEALLRLGQRELEAGQFRSALAWLSTARDHPDLHADATRRAAHVQYMTGLASHYVGEHDRATASLNALAEFGVEFEPLRERLQAAIAADHASGASSAIGSTLWKAGMDGLSSLDFGAAADLDDLVAEPIWGIPLEDSLASRRIASAEDQPLSGTMGTVLQQRYRDLDFTTAVPTVAGETVFINEGHTIRAIHRVTGRELWTYSSLPTAAGERDLVVALDLNVVAVAGGSNPHSVVALTGHAQPNTRSESGRVVCIDAQSGQLRWSQNLSGVIEGAEQLFAHGAPLIVDDTVFVAARRVSTQMTSAYVIALDLESGQPRWTRYITSSGGLRAGTRPFDTLVYDHAGESGFGLFMASAAGAIARLEPTTGEIRWLSRYSVPINIGMLDPIRRPWEMAGPAVTPLGVIAISPDQRRILVLDAETGSLRQSYPSTSAADWNQPRYLLADDSMVYAIGSEIRAFDLNALDHPVWTLPARTSEADGRTSPMGVPRSSSSSGSLELRGRVQLVEGALIVPASDGIVVVDSVTGQIQHRLNVEHVGNPLAVDAQLLIASDERLDAYMSFDRAERLLRERIAQSPHEPEPAISLLRLAMRVEQLPLALEAADLAMRAIGASPPPGGQVATSQQRSNARAELFGLLLELAGSEIAAAPADGELVYAALNAAAVENAHRIEYLLAYGDWLVSHALDRAVESYQSILTNPTLANLWRLDAGVVRPAAASARQRLSDLIANRGPNVYAPQAHYAEMRLNQITAAAEIDLNQLETLAREYPFAEAAARAAAQGASIDAGRGEHRRAIATLWRTYREGPFTLRLSQSPNDRRRVANESASILLGAFVDLCAQIGWTEHARAAMVHAQAHFGEIALRTASGNTTPAQWIAANSDARPGERRLPTIGAHATEARPIAGSVVEWYFGGAGGASQAIGDRRYPADRALVRVGDTLRMVTASGVDPRWTATLGGFDQTLVPQLLRMNERDILLWLNGDPNDPKAIMINAEDGAVRWTTPRISDLLDSDPVRDLGRTRGVRDQMPDGEPFDPLQTLALVERDTIVMVQRTGGMVAIDLRDGQTVHWTKPATSSGLEQVHAAALHEGALVLAGAARDIGGGGQRSPRLLVLDPNTGDVIASAGGRMQNRTDSLEHWPLTAGVKWMRISPLGELIIGTAQGLHAVDLYSGSRLWSTAAYVAIDSRRGWLFGDRLVMEDQRSRLRTVDLHSGFVSEAFESPPRSEWDPSELRQVMYLPGARPRVIAHYPQRIVVYDADSGEIAGIDVISDDRDYRWMLPAAERLVLVNSRTIHAPVPDQPGRRSQQWVYRLYLLSENGKVLNAPIELPPVNERVQQAVVIDGAVLLSTQSETLAIPMSDPE